MIADIHRPKERGESIARPSTNQPGPPESISTESRIQYKIVKPLMEDDVPPAQLQSALNIIGDCLARYGQQGSWGTVLVLGYENREESHPTPTVVLGFPSPPRLDEVSQGEAWPLPLKISTSVIEGCVMGSEWRPRTSWMNTPIVFRQKMNIGPQSIGCAASLSDARSFGGYFKSIGSGTVMGLSCSHVFPDATIGQEICSPSALELTARAETIAVYTNHDPGDGPPKRRAARQNELDDMLVRFCEMSSETGASLRGRPSKVILSGGGVGAVIAREQRYVPDILDRHNAVIGGNGFAMPNSRSYPSKLDWALFRMEPGR